MPLIGLALRLIFVQTVIALCGIGLATVLGPSLSQGILIVMNDIPSPNFRIYAVDVGTRITHSLSKTLGSDFPPFWSPDGLYLTFMSDRGDQLALYRMDSNGGNTIRIQNTGINDRYANLSPDGRYLAYGENVSTVNYIRILDLYTGTHHTLTSISNENSYTVWSPDATMLVFQDHIYHTNTRESTILYVMDIAQLDDSRQGLRQVASFANDVSSLAWSPDSNYIVIGYEQGYDETQIWDIDIINIYTGETTTLLQQPASVFNLAWSPDGTIIAFSSERDGDMDIYLIDIATGNVCQITDEPHHESFPTWSPDGRTIAYVSSNSGRHYLYVISLNDDTPRLLVGLSFFGFPPSWQPDPSVSVGAAP